MLLNFLMIVIFQCKLRMERDREMIELQRKIQNCPVSCSARIVHTHNYAISKLLNSERKTIISIFAICLIFSFSCSWNIFMKDLVNQFRWYNVYCENFNMNYKPWLCMTYLFSSAMSYLRQILVTSIIKNIIIILRAMFDFEWNFKPILV